MQKSVFVGEKIIKLLSTTNNITFWVYSLHETEWNDYLKFNATYDDHLATPNDIPIKKNDVILMYLNKQHPDGGFVGITSCVQKYDEEDELEEKIFRNKHYNKYILETQPMIIFKKSIMYKELASCIDKNRPNFRNAATFKTKYVNDKKPIMKLEFNGKNMANKLLIIHNVTMNTEQEMTIDDNSSDSSSDDSNDPLSISSHNNHSSNDPLSEESISDSTDKITDDSNSETGEGDEDEGEDDDSYEHYDDMPGGCIPIHINKCKKFAWPKSTKKKPVTELDKNNYFIEHYRTCTECEKINNNNIDIMGYVNEKNMEIITVDDDDDMFIETKTYHVNDKKYKPEDFDQSPYVRVLDVITENKKHLYYNDIFIAWSTD